MTARPDEIKIAAQVARWGMDPMKFLTSTDDFEIFLMQAVATEAEDQNAEIMDAQAKLIAGRVWERASGGS